MKVTLSNGDYIFRWHHELPQPKTPQDVHGGLDGGTTCEVHRVLPRGTVIKVAESKIRCFHRDQFSKKVGRKYSLDNALHLALLNREDRTLVWNAYWKMIAPPAPAKEVGEVAPLEGTAV